jgi:DNA-binding MarR family transcriptional regulator
MYSVKQVELAVRAQLDALLRPAGVTALQYTALTVLARHNDLTTAALARNSFVATQSMADLVGALERHGLVSRQQDPTHKRRVLIHLTDEGRQLITDHAEAVDAIESLMTQGLTGRQVAALRSALNQCRENLSDTPAH